MLLFHYEEEYSPLLSLNEEEENRAAHPAYKGVFLQAGIDHRPREVDDDAANKDGASTCISVRKDNPGAAAVGVRVAPSGNHTARRANHELGVHS